MTAGLLNVGRTALMAAYAQLQTTSHNIANAATPGYSRQEVQLASGGANFSGGGYIGRGVQVTTVARQYDAYIARELAGAESINAADAARAEQMARVDRLFADPDTGVGAAIDALTAALSDLVNTPYDESARIAVLSRAEALGQRINSLDGQLAQLGQNVEQRLEQGTREVNDLLRQIATLNEQISSVKGTGQPPNDLLDQRDLLINEVNKYLRATTVDAGDGTVNLFAAGGEALVVGKTASTLRLQADPLDATRSQLALEVNGARIAFDSDALGGGKLAGLLRFRDDDLASVRNRLGQLAGALAGGFNAQQAAGLDADGLPGQPMFATGTPQVLSSRLNTGDATFSLQVVDPAALAPSDYTLSFDGSSWQISTQPGGEVRTLPAGFPGTAAEFDGLRLTLTGGAAAGGDRFSLKSASAFASGFAATLSSAARLATGLAMTTETGAANQGDLRVTGFATVDASNANLTSPVTLTFDGAGSFDVSGTGTGDPAGVAYVPGQTITYNGWSLELLGTPAAGDTITIVPVADPATDNRNARALAELVDGPLVGGRPALDVYASLVGEVGVRGQAARSAQTLSGGMLDEVRAAREEVSGVNLDEEAARLLQYQQQYQAAARVMATAQSMFEELIRLAN